jgi:F0F1-type ATP synthase membrane subunit b/b'
MPQFDLYSYPSQVFCVLLGFVFFYFFILRFYLAPFSKVLKMRQKLKKLGLHLKELKEKRKTSESFDLYSSFLRKIFKK